MKAYIEIEGDGKWRPKVLLKNVQKSYRDLLPSHTSSRSEAEWSDVP